MKVQNTVRCHWLQKINTIKKLNLRELHFYTKFDDSDVVKQVLQEI